MRACSPTLLLILAAACQVSPKSFSDADRAAIRADLDSFPVRVLRKDWPKLASTYSTDTRFMPPNQKIVVGRQAFQTWLGTFPPVTAFRLKPDTIAGEGDMAYVYGHYSMTIAPHGAPRPVADSGKFLEVHRRQADGSWLTVADMFNSDISAAPAAAAKPKPPAKRRTSTRRH